MKKLWSRVLSVLLLSLIISDAQLPAYAAGAIDTGKDVSYTVSYTKSGTAISGAKFDIYRVADVDAYAQMTFTSRFASYPISLKWHDKSSWNALATTLKGYVWKDGITPDFSAMTDGNGDFTMSLKPGLYLVIGYDKELGSYVYSVSPYLVFLPGNDLENNVWDYKLTSYPKSVSYTKPSSGGGGPSGGGPGSDLTMRRVLKIWDDDLNESLRPDSISVHLMRDGKVYDTVQLNEANGWSYSWFGIDRYSDWLVTEDSVPGYTQSIAQEGLTFTVTNTLLDVDIKPAEEDKPILLLPQTGIMWWPSLILLAGGLMLVVIGLIRRKGNDRE
mgnify:FL=1